MNNFEKILNKFQITVYRTISYQYLHSFFKINTNNLEFKKLLINSIIFGAIYIIFMIYIDIPGYYSKWKNKRKYYTISDGLISMYSCKKSQLYSIWKSDMLWLTGYFTLCVWGSIYLVKWYENNF